MIFLENLVILEIINLDVAERILWRNNLYEKNVKKTGLISVMKFILYLKVCIFLSFTHVCDAAYVWVCVCVCMYIFVYECMCVQECFVCECMWVFCVNVSVHIYSYMWSYTYIHTLFEPYLKFNRIEGAIVHSHN